MLELEQRQRKQLSLKSRILRLRIEARTLLADAREVTMTEDDGIRIVGLQRLQQGMQGSIIMGRRAQNLRKI